MKEFLIKVYEAAGVIAFLTLCVIMVMVACIVGLQVAEYLRPSKETICVADTVYVKENNYWTKTGKECFPSIPVSKD